MIFTIGTPKGDADIVIHDMVNLKEQLKDFCSNNDIKLDLLDALEDYIQEKYTAQNVKATPEADATPKSSSEVSKIPSKKSTATN